MTTGFLLFLLPVILSSQGSPVLETYIQGAFSNSHVLKEKQFRLEKSLAALEEARRMFYPDVTFGATYSLAAGGRSIAFPIGDLLNPVYGTLNELTQSNAFPQLENVNEQLLPNNFYDARFRARQPLINAEIRYNRQIKATQVSLQEIDIQLYRRELVRDLKSAYFRFLQAGEAVKIYENAIRLLQESRRVNESLLRNDKAIPSVLIRTDSEIASVQAQLTEARNQQRNAAAYFNHLAGRNLEEAIEVDSSLTLNTLETTAQGKREELEQLARARDINQLVVRLEESYRNPHLSLQLDLGSQNFDFKWGGYALLGLSVEIPVWSANRNKLQVQQASLDGQALQEQALQVENLIRLEVQTARNTLAAEQEVWRSYEAQLEGSRRFYNDTFRRYREGVASYIELLDARTQLTSLEVRRSITYFNVMIRQAELERALAAYPVR